ncbi:MAG: D-alanine--D-alanine ligase [Lachnospiraceae bacterium]|nr:D-alanine--D-alanine ligase [Lachnospiraceae bacterium]
MEKKNLVVLFGGQSSEHEVSCISVVTVIESVDTEKYDMTFVGITKQGQWLKVDSVKQIQDGTWRDSKISAVISPDATRKELIIKEGDSISSKKIDVVFPVLHGLYGEDGTVQGLLELAKIPYVGCGVLASSVSMDKLYTKIVVDTLNIRQAKYIGIRKGDWKGKDAVIAKIEEAFSYPVFVKPSNAGSSKGVSKANNREELVVSIEEAFCHDKKVLVEETIIGRELECAVLGGNEVKAASVGEVLAASNAAFYDFDAKYNNQESKTVIDPELPEGKTEEIQKAAVEIFKAVDGFGLSRVDFFLEKDTNEVVFNEINTMPGFTSISMYPMLWGAKGVDKKELVQTLLDLSLERE